MPIKWLSDRIYNVRMIKYIMLKLGIAIVIAAIFLLAYFIGYFAEEKTQLSSINAPDVNSQLHHHVPIDVDNDNTENLEEEFESTLDPLGEEVSYKVVVKKGDTLLKILQAHSTKKEDIKPLLIAVDKRDKPIKMVVGQTVSLTYEPEIIEDDSDIANEILSLQQVVIEVDPEHKITFSKKGAEFLIENLDIPTTRELVKRRAVIHGSLIDTMKKMGITSTNIVELINAYSYQIDFQRQIKDGDSVTVIYEKFLTAEKKFSHYGKIIYADLNLSGHNYEMYRYKTSKDSVAEFFTADGKSIKRSLLRTPLKVTRISSDYGNRKHPTLGYTKMHTGVDFSAPTGTPIYSAGDGVVTKVGWVSGYGNFVEIKHNDKLSTAYAHASKIAKGLKKGSKVKQGQVIAYVGSTGRATGPHLHYEIKIGGKHVNPTKYKTAAGKELKGNTLKAFKLFQEDVKNLSAHLNKTNDTPSTLILEKVIKMTS